MQNKDQITPNKDFIIQSLQRQLSSANTAMAELEAIISQLYQELEKEKEKSNSKGAAKK